jgi:transcriptional regulator with XRE-family HTH domain
MSLDPARAGQDRITLADALRDLRRISGLSGQRLAERCQLSQSKISRIETGRLLPSILDVERILSALDVNNALKADLLALAKVANAEYRDIRARVRRGLHHSQRDLAALEADATQMRHFLPALITGLLQAPDYLAVAANPPVGPASCDPSRAVALKLERQAVLHDVSKRFEFLLTESVVRWQLCQPSVMAMQLDHLISVSRLPTVCIGVLPLSVQVADGPMHTFVTYDDRLATAELFTGSIVFRDPKDVEYYRELFEYFAGHALWGDEARAFLATVAADFRAGPGSA